MLEDAILTLGESLKLNGKFIPSLLAISEIYTKLERFDLARENLKILLAIEPENKQGLKLKKVIK